MSCCRKRLYDDLYSHNKQDTCDPSQMTEEEKQKEKRNTIQYLLMIAAFAVVIILSKIL